MISDEQKANTVAVSWRNLIRALYGQFPSYNGYTKGKLYKNLVSWYDTSEDYI